MFTTNYLISIKALKIKIKMMRKIEIHLIEIIVHNNIVLF